jgi:hypothetical protein
MKTHFLLNMAATIVLASAAMLFLNSNHTSDSGLATSLGGTKIRTL